jgi:two-component system phosphate regulon sensor histidine kinase PhoR
MPHLILLLLSIALAYTLRQLWQHRQAVRGLHRAIQTRTAYLEEEAPGGFNETWDGLRVAVNGLVGELSRLQEQRSGQLAQLQATLGSLQEAVLIVDRDNYILLANRALQGMFPDATSILNQRVERVLHSSSFLSYVEQVRANAAEPQQEVEFVSGGRSIWLEVTGTLVPAGSGQKGPWLLFVLHDITKLRKLELVRKDFVANVSHELRTPLSVIKGYIETLVDGHQDMNLEDRERFLRTIQRHTERLNSLLEDLLTLSRLESINPGLRRESSDFTQLLAGVEEDYRARPAAAGHVLSFQVTPALEPVLIDPLKITQVLENLIDNALKYTPKGSTITVAVRRHEAEIEVSVSDDGPGIPPADLPHIFERFYRVDKGRSREKGGTGLGLSIVKHIVQLHHGRVWVDSVQGAGSTFSFSLPLRDQGGGEEPPSSPASDLPAGPAA